MRKRLPGLLAWAACAALTLAGCGGGGDAAMDGGTGGTGVSFGAVTDFGSIFVNGVEFSTNGASIKRDDAVVGESELRRGMVVEVHGSFSSVTAGTATTVLVEEAVRGPLESKNGTLAAGATLVALGQTVHVDEATFIDNNVCDLGDACASQADRFAAIDVGDVLEVHGQRTDDGSISATFVERKTAPVTFVVRGTVLGHAAATQTFSIGALTVNYGGANVGDMPAPTGSNWNGMFVEVKGTNCSGALPVCGTLTATKVEPEGVGAGAAEQAEVEGFVTSFVSVSEFTLGSQLVRTSGSTLFLGGDPGEITLGVKLEAEGSLVGSVLTASKVKFKESVKIESNATATATTITLEGLPGITVTANAFTEFKNTGATAGNLVPLDGKSVRIRGRASGTASVVATEIEDRGGPDSRAILQGFATNVTSPNFDILGVTVDTSSLAAANFKDANDNAIGAAAFYSALAAGGRLVKARGKLPAVNALGAATLEEAELED